MPSPIENLSVKLVLEHYGSVYRFADQLVDSACDVDDLVQRAFLRTQHHLSSGNTIDAPLSFLFVAVRDLVNERFAQEQGDMVDSPLLDLSDSNSSDSGSVIPESTSPDSSSDENDTRLEGRAVSVGRQTMSQLEFDQLCDAVARLPEHLRDAFILRRIYGYSCREAGEQLGLPTNAIRMQIAQAFKRLRK